MATEYHGDGVVTLSDVETLVGSWGMQVCCGSSSGDVDGDGGVGANDLSIILAEFGTLGDSETCDIVECGPEGGLGPLQKCRREANRRFWKCATIGMSSFATLKMLYCAGVCAAPILGAPPLAPAVCLTCLNGTLGQLGGVLFSCALDWFLNYSECTTSP